MLVFHTFRQFVLLNMIVLKFSILLLILIIFFCFLRYYLAHFSPSQDLNRGNIFFRLI